MSNLENKTVIVTGGGSGLGRSVCIEYARQKANVVFCGRREKEGNETLEVLKTIHSKAVFVKTDITNEKDVQSLVWTALDRFGSVDILVNNAAVSGKKGRIADLSLDEFQEIVDINLKGAWLCMKYCIPEMLKKGKGSIVNVSSAAGMVGVAFGAGIYSATKHALVGLSKSGALEYGAKGIRVNAVCPGTFQTEMLDWIFNNSPDPEKARQKIIDANPVKRIGGAEEIANVIVWISSDSASFVNGAVLPVDGGFTAG